MYSIKVLYRKFGTLFFLSSMPKKLKDKTDGQRDKFIFYQDKFMF